MKTPTKKGIVAKKLVLPKEKEETTPAKNPTYELIARINSEIIRVEGEDMTMFNQIRPAKVTTKGIFELHNRETGKRFEIVYPPLLAKKLLTSPFIQTVQWKRLSGKVA